MVVPARSGCFACQPVILLHIADLALRLVAVLDDLTQITHVEPLAAGQAFHEMINSRRTNNFTLPHASRSVTATQSELRVRTDKSVAARDAILSLRNVSPAGAISTPTTYRSPLPDAAGRVVCGHGAAQAKRCDVDHRFRQQKSEKSDAIYLQFFATKIVLTNINL
jgi:hypothetical protein